MDIVEFLTARIYERDPVGVDAWTVDPADVEFLRAEAEAKRAIIALHPPRDPGWSDECATCDDNRLAYDRTRSEWPCPTLLALASVYIDHPDFDPAWRVEPATT